jgi:hypothetical protein
MKASCSSLFLDEMVVDKYMCLGRNGLGGKPVTSTALELWFLEIGLGDSDWTDLVIHMGSIGRFRKGNGGRSH